MTKKQKAFLADIALLAAALTWGLGFVAGDVAAENLPVFWIMAIRFLTAAAVSGVLFRRAVRRSEQADRKAGSILGILIFLAMPLQVIGLKYTSPSKQAFLVASYVVVTPFFSWLILHERPQRKAFVSGFLTLCGIGLISLNSTFGMELGDILSLGFALVYSVGIVATGIYARKTDPLAISFFQYLTVGILSLVSAILFGERPAAMPVAVVAALLYLAVVNTVGGFTLQNVAQRYTSDTHAAVLISTESVFGYFFSVIFYNDPFTLRIFLGGMIVFAAVLLSAVEWKKNSISG